MALNTGVFNSTFNPAELNTPSFNAAILRLYPGGNAPLFGLSSQTRKSRAVSSTHGYFTKRFTFNTLTMTVAAIAADVSLTVASSAGLVPDMTFQVPVTREIVKVTAITSATVVAVTRGYGRIAAGAIGITDVLSGTGNAQVEGSLRPTARNITSTYVPNFTEVFRNAWSVTGTAQASLTQAGFGNVGENREDAAKFHAGDIEASAFMGQAQMNLAGAQPEHTSQGVMDAVYQYAPTNVIALAATTNYTQFSAALTPGFNTSTDLGNARLRVGFCDATTLRVINQIALLNGHLTISSDQTTFGLDYTTIKFYKGEIKLIEHPMFNDLPAFAGTMVTIDLPAFRLAYLNGRDALREEYNNKGQNTSGTDAVGGSLTSELAFELVNPGACQVVSGFTAGAAG